MYKRQRLDYGEFTKFIGSFSAGGAPGGGRAAWEMPSRDDREAFGAAKRRAREERLLARQMVSGFSRVVRACVRVAREREREKEREREREREENREGALPRHRFELIEPNRIQSNPIEATPNHIFALGQSPNRPELPRRWRRSTR